MTTLINTTPPTTLQKLQPHLRHPEIKHRGIFSYKELSPAIQCADGSEMSVQASITTALHGTTSGHITRSKCGAAEPLKRGQSTATGKTRNPAFKPSTFMKACGL